MARITMGKRPEKATKTEQADTHVTANGIDLGASQNLDCMQIWLEVNGSGSTCDARRLNGWVRASGGAEQWSLTSPGPPLRGGGSAGVGEHFKQRRGRCAGNIWLGSGWVEVAKWWSPLGLGRDV